MTNEDDDDENGPVYVDVAGPAPVGDQLQMTVRYQELRAGKGWHAELRVWVPYSDSIEAMKAAARKEATLFLERALGATDLPRD